MKKITSILLVLAMLIALPLLSSCGGYDAELPIRVWTLNGTTGFGMAQLINASPLASALISCAIPKPVVPFRVQTRMGSSAS